MFQFHDDKVKVGDEVFTVDEFYEEYPDAPRIRADVVTMEYCILADGSPCYREFYETPKGMKQRGAIGEAWKEADDLIRDKHNVRDRIFKQRVRKKRERDRELGISDHP